MRAEELTTAWVEKTLTEDMIIKYLTENFHNTKYHDPETVSRVAYILHSIYQWSTNQTDYLGDFARAIVDNDLTEAVHRADSLNLTALWLYPAFLYNVAPVGWRENNVRGA